MFPTLADDRNRYITFQILGFYGGGVFPLLLIVLFSMYSHHSLLDQESILLMLTVLIIIIFVGTAAFAIGFVSTENITFRIFFWLQAVVSVGAIHISVLFSGGSIQSVMAYSYLYLPAVVGFVYPKRGNIYWLSSFISISYLGNLCFLDEQKKSTSWLLIGAERVKILEENVSCGAKTGCAPSFWQDGGWVYLSIFLVQLFITAYIAGRGRIYLGRDMPRQPTSMPSES